MMKGEGREGKEESIEEGGRGEGEGKKLIKEGDGREREDEDCGRGEKKIKEGKWRVWRGREGEGEKE